MQIFDYLKNQIYDLVKRNKKVRAFAFLYLRSMKTFLNLFRSFFASSEERMPPTKFCRSIKTWIDSSKVDDSNSQAKCIKIPLNNTISKSPPKTLDKHVHFEFIKKKWRKPVNFVAVIPRGKVWGRGNVITPDNKLLLEVSAVMHKKGHLTDYFIFPKKMPSPRKLKETVAVLSAPGGRGYFHWMFNILPRIELLRKAGINLDDVDKFLVNSYISRFHMETLSALGIKRKKIIESDWNPYIKADELIVPSLIGFGYIPKWACDFLRKEFLNIHSKKIKTDFSDRIYISRSNAANRKVINEDEIIAFLNKKDFQNINLESFTVAEQALILSSAKIVVAPHGAGLTNLVFCNPGTKVIEIFPHNKISTLYWTLSNQIGLEYYYLICERKKPLNLGHLSEILNLAGIE